MGERNLSEEEKRKLASERVTTWRRAKQKAGERYIGVWADYHVKTELDELAYRRHQTPGEALRDAVRVLTSQMDAGTGGVIPLETKTRHLLAQEAAQEAIKILAAQGVAPVTAVGAPPVTPPPLPAGPRPRPGDLPAPDGVTYMLGKLCRKGHDYKGTGQSLLYAKNKGCLECNRERKLSK